ncbi:MAG: N-acetylmuramoyl-L-alanine amidase [Elusimicrobia bacterium]|nr:N-acetylmuramoyl-L-alanine amidase [Elusimicrobiota bacterium]
MRPTFLILFLSYLVSVTSVSGAAKAELIYDGDYLQKTEIQTARGTPYISIKAIASLLKGKTQWYPVGEKIVLQLNNQKITFAQDSRTILIGDKKTSLSSPTQLKKGVLWAPLEFFLEERFTALADCTVRYDPSALILSAEPKTTLYPPRIFSRTHSTKIVLESAEEFSPELKKKGKNITVDMPKVRIGKVGKTTFKDALVESIEITRLRKGTSLKVSLARDTTNYVWTQMENPPRLVLEIRKDSISGTISGPTVHAKEDSLEIKFAEKEGASAIKKSLEKRKKNKKEHSLPPVPATKRIVIDAGHGGQDPGAIGKKGTKEKDINLLIALELARVLRIEGEYEIVLTRSDDTFIPLTERSWIANEKKADLFISIHCNAAMRRKEGGFEIYFLSENASDPHAEHAAEFENSVIRMEGPPTAKSRKIQELLFSMARNEFINESSLLCHTINETIQKRVGVRSRGVKQANFHVLHGAQMPSVLIETGFLTNSLEEQKLRERKFRSAVVDAIFSGIQNYEHQLALLQDDQKL